MGIKSKMMKAAPMLASRPTRSQRKKDALASKAEATARAAAEGKRPTAGTRSRPSWLKSDPQGLAATLRRRPTAGTRSRPSWLKSNPQGLSSRKRSR